VIIAIAWPPTSGKASRTPREVIHRHPARVKQTRMQAIAAAGGVNCSKSKVRVSATQRGPLTAFPFADIVSGVLRRPPDVPMCGTALAIVVPLTNHTVERRCPVVGDGASRKALS
jgi:hypothetical protein